MATAKASKKAASSRKSSSKKSTAKKASSSKKATSSKKASSSKKATSAKKATSSKKTSTSKKAASKRTTSHATIRRWVEARGGFPATVTGTESRGEEAGLLRIDYPGYSGEDTLERIDWDDWFAKFDAEKLAFLYQDKRNSRFSKLVRR